MYRFLKQNDQFRDDIAILQDKIKEIEGYFIHGEIDEYLYFSVPDSIILYLDDIESIQTLPALEQSMYFVLIEPQLKDISPHYELVNKRVQAKIRELYTLEDELKIHRLRFEDPESFESYNQWCEECRNWGKEQKILMGFVSNE